LPQDEEERKHYAHQVGADGWTLLQALHLPSTADWLKTLPAVMTLRCIWQQQFEPFEEARARASGACFTCGRTHQLTG
jgi:hypothetical protein